MTESIREIEMQTKCTAGQMMKVLIRNSGLSETGLIPEHKLIFAIIGNAVSDTSFRNTYANHKWFRTKSFERYCSLVELNPETVRSLLVTGGFLPAQKGLKCQ